MTGIPRNGVAVTPSDSVSLTQASKMLYVTGTGTLSLLMGGGTTVSMTVAANSYHTIAVKRVNFTGTTATGIVAFY